MSRFLYQHEPLPGESSITIKLRVESGCFHREHSPEAYSIIDHAISEIPIEERHFDFIEHESGPEIIAWIALGTAGISLSSSIIALVTAIINARVEGRKKGDRANGRLVLLIRDTYRTNTSTEEFVMEIHDKELISSEQVKAAIEKGLKKRGGK